MPSHTAIFALTPATTFFAVRTALDKNDNLRDYVITTVGERRGEDLVGLSSFL